MGSAQLNTTPLVVSFALPDSSRAYPRLNLGRQRRLLLVRWRWCRLSETTKATSEPLPLHKAPGPQPVGFPFHAALSCRRTSASSSHLPRM
jgi:hypothetical protein